MRGHRMLGFGIPLVAVAALLGVAWFNQFGSFAHSPQIVALPMGRAAFVGGGRATLAWVGVNMGPELEVTCKQGTQTLELRPGDESEEVCGVRLRLLEFDDVSADPDEMLQQAARQSRKPLTVKVEVSWK